MTKPTTHQTECGSEGTANKDPIKFPVTVGELWWSKTFPGSQWRLVAADFTERTVTLEYAGYKWSGNIAYATHEFYQNKEYQYAQRVGRCIRTVENQPKP